MIHECENQEGVQLELGGSTISKRNEQIWFANGSKTWLLIFIEFYIFFFSLNPIVCVCVCPRACTYVCALVRVHTCVCMYAHTWDCGKVRGQLQVSSLTLHPIAGSISC